MQRAVRNRNTMQIDKPFNVSLSSSSKEDKLNYCPIPNTNTPEVQELVKELDKLNNRKTQIYERLNELSQLKR